MNTLDVNFVIYYNNLLTEISPYILPICFLEMYATFADILTNKTLKNKKKTIPLCLLSICDQEKPNISISWKSVDETNISLKL